MKCVRRAPRTLGKKEIELLKQKAPGDLDINEQIFLSRLCIRDLEKRVDNLERSVLMHYLKL